MLKSIHDALVLGIKDYLHNSGFTKAVIGLSGGIDSALVCALASEALGPAQVTGISMPSQYSSKGSLTDAAELAQNCGINYITIPIQSIFDTYLETVAPVFSNTESDVTEENLQARIRGNLLMAYSNKFGHFVLATGNRSEAAMGYCTLYGDTCGGLSVISELSKTMVYKLSHYINRDQIIIPQSIIEKPPSAELRPNQKDQDSLPPYDVLDPILDLYIDRKYSAEQIIANGLEPDTVHWVIDTYRKTEYKRQQSPPGLKVLPSL